MPPVRGVMPFIFHFSFLLLCLQRSLTRHTHKLRPHRKKPAGKVHNRRIKTFTVRILSYKQPKKKIIMHQNTFLHILYSVMPSDSAKMQRSVSKNKYNFLTFVTVLPYISSVNIVLWSIPRGNVQYFQFRLAASLRYRHMF